MSRHIGQDWRKKHLAFVLQVRMEHEKRFRDTWLEMLTDVVMRSSVPLAKTLPHPSMFQRKVACFRYNQYGLHTTYFNRAPLVDHVNAIRGTLGTRDWVPYLNLSSWSTTRKVSRGQLLCARVNYRGYGTDRSLLKGGWQFRWNKVLERNVLHLTRL